MVAPDDNLQKGAHEIRKRVVFWSFQHPIKNDLKKGIIMSINSNKEPNIRGEVAQLRRIADILDEILRLVKKDMEKYEEKKSKK